MPQIGRPDADIVDGSWTKGSGGAVDMFAEIDETVADDADYIQSELAPISSASGIGLSNVSDPLSSSGHILRWRARSSTGSDTIDGTIQLRQGYASEASQGTLIASQVVTNMGTAFTDRTVTLTGAEADAITDYTDLQLRFLANEV